MGRFKNHVGSITINGDTFPAAINYALMDELEAEGIDFNNLLGDEKGRFKRIACLVTKAINTGYRLSGSNERVTDSEVLDVLSPDNHEEILNQIAALLGQSGRKVIAEPPKN